MCEKGKVQQKLDARLCDSALKLRTIQARSKTETQRVFFWLDSSFSASLRPEQGLFKRSQSAENCEFVVLFFIYFLYSIIIKLNFVTKKFNGAKRGFVGGVQFELQIK